MFCLSTLAWKIGRHRQSQDLRARSISSFSVSNQTSPMIQRSTLFPESHGNKSQPRVSCLRWESLEQSHKISHISALRESTWWLPVLFGNCTWNRKRARPGELLKEGGWENAEATCLHQHLRIGRECGHLRECRQEELLSKDQYHPLHPLIPKHLHNLQY